jgi:predicted aconitase with swiveling domain
MGTAPAAFIFTHMTTKIALGAVVTHAPAMTDFDLDPLTHIATGDWVSVNADEGWVEVRPASATDTAN